MVVPFVGEKFERKDGKNMKLWNKTIAGALALLLVLPFSLAGCGKDETPDTPENEEQTSADQGGDTQSGDHADNDDTFEDDLSKYVTLGTYKGIEVEPYTKTVTEDDVQTQVMMARVPFATVAEKEGPVAKGDQVVIDFVGYMNGETFEGGSAQDYPLMIGSGSMIDGFEDGIVGAAKGETVTLDIAFPDPYPNNPDFAGLPVRFDVTVKTVYEQALPVYDDAFVQENYECASVEEFEKIIYEALVKQNEAARENHILTQVLETISETFEIKGYPSGEYAKMYQANLNYFQALAEQEGITLNEYALHQFGMDVSTFYESLETSIYTVMQEQMVLLRIAQEEGISITEDEYKAGVAEYVEYYGVSTEAELFEAFSEEEVRRSILIQKVYDFLIANTVEKE